MPRPSKQEIPTASCDRILRNKLEMSGHRISDDGAKALAEVLEQVAIEIGNTAWGLMAHVGRKTIIRTDIDIAYRMLLPNIERIRLKKLKKDLENDENETLD